MPSNEISLQFLNIKTKVLLGFSGGADSMALFYLFLEDKIPFSAAYIDHGWRKESAEEGEKLRALCDSKGVLFHTIRLPPSRGYNLEEEGREARFAFFKDLCGEYGYEAVMLAHHADDQAEVVLKRVFEGATLRRLKGLAFESHREGIRIIRPLLQVKKAAILKWLNSRQISYFEDSTNKDCRFLRPRLRHQMLPYLSEVFGKEISSSLCRLGQSASELDEFLTHVLAPYRERTVLNNEWSELDLATCQPRTYFEWKLVVHDFFERQNCTISTYNNEMIVLHLKRKSIQKEWVIGKGRVILDRGVLKYFPNCGKLPSKPNL